MLRGRTLNYYASTRQVNSRPLLLKAHARGKATTARLTSDGNRADGRKPSQLTGKFRADFRMALLMVAARRAAAVQQGGRAGLPSCCVRGDVLDIRSCAQAT